MGNATLKVTYIVAKGYYPYKVNTPQAGEPRTERRGEVRHRVPENVETYCNSIGPVTPNTATHVALLVFRPSA
ncbi:MAG: hypothetical protein NVSMB6_15650 [Burkholderiaceae bacterium]